MTAPQMQTPGGNRASAEKITENAPIVTPAARYCNHAVMETLRGHSAALEAIQDARSGTADPDLFHARLQAVILAGSHERLRGFLRTIQKAVESNGERP